MTTNHSLTDKEVSELKTLIASYKLNEVKDLEEYLLGLTQLELVNYADFTLPDSLGKLDKLEELRLYDCKITTLPDSIGNLNQLKKLELSGTTSITALPESIGALTNLQDLYCSYKNITALPLSFPQLINLKDDYLRTALQKINQTQEQRKLLDILLCTLKIREELLVDISHFPKNDYETTVAHYTTPYVAMKLLTKEETEDKSKKDKQNPLWLSSVTQVNDPKEGKVIFDYLNQLDILKENNIVLKSVSTIESASELATFVGCFDFNHDNLNQFRLYGKELGKEATGVSIVINPRFFTLHHSNVFSKNPSNTQNNPDINEKLLPLYRCIYLNPKGKLNGKPYIQVACRNKVTFYCEKGRTDNDLKEYMKYINHIQDNVNQQFEKIQNNIQLLFKDINNKKEEEKEKLIETVSFILLPLSYMIKHSAYEEEQECRILKFIYVDFDKPSEEIKIDINNKQMYVEYLPIESCVKKIYLSPGAEQYADMFRMLTNGTVEIRSSDNPFR